MGGWKGDEDGEARNMGPWYTHRAPVSQQIGKVNTKKVQCGVCEVRPSFQVRVAGLGMRSSVTTGWSLPSASHCYPCTPAINRVQHVGAPPVWCMAASACYTWNFDSTITETGQHHT